MEYMWVEQIRECNRNCLLNYFSIFSIFIPISDLSQFDLQADDRTLVHEAKDSSDELEYSTCYTTLCVSPHAGKEEAEQSKLGISGFGEGELT